MRQPGNAKADLRHLATENPSGRCVSANKQIAHWFSLASVLGLRAASDGFSMIRRPPWRRNLASRFPVDWEVKIMSLTNVWSRVKAFPPSRGRVASRTRFLRCIVLLSLFFGTVSPACSQFIYFSEAITPGDIRRANLDGSGQVTLVSRLVGPIGPTLDLAGGQMYWADTDAGDIRRANLDGSDQTTLVSGLPPADSGPSAFPPALDLAHGHMYWTDGGDSGPGVLRRANLDGSEQTTLVTGLRRPRGVALDLAGGQMYWGEAGSGRIRRANLDGSGLTTLLEGLNNPQGVALDFAGSKIYWGEGFGADIRRANLDGSGQEILVRNQGHPVASLLIWLAARCTGIMVSVATSDEPTSMAPDKKF